ncbi:MAG TPA: glycosyltransferase [Leptolyngbyaceae cyanobacterium M33_DOE_097]|uniref:Glycosyltransferase n=1 Tax=Oscillatoriales cyanobacterium SpSt-418 TaxID=2282169 RepID=A0A7C3KEH6_9CYAN|nr:glycosyltransferase [Leptolyngbyaceae cyanobacterium M33_DOE_097]
MTAYLVTLKRKFKIFLSIWQQDGGKTAVKRTYQWFRKRFIKQRLYSSYESWILENQLKPEQIQAATAAIQKWENQPKFSIIMPVYNVNAVWLKKAIQSVQNQIYSNWELCIADDASTESYIAPILKRYSRADSRIKVVFRTENGGISAASNDALAIATGDYIALLDHDDELAIDALYENAKLINQHPEADFIYSDEDKIDPSGTRISPFLKPGWSPDFFHQLMYTCHLGVYRTSLVRKIGGFRSEFDGSQDYDLVLRFTEHTQNIFHIPKFLYHWRIIPASTSADEQAKPWAYTASQRALQESLDRSPYPGTVEQCTYGPSIYFKLHRKLIDQPVISIVIPSAGKIGNVNGQDCCLLENCVKSILENSTYTNIEVVIIDGCDIPNEVFERLEERLLHSKAVGYKFIHANEPFNYSKRINQGVAAATGEFVVLLNDDTEVIAPDWLESMLELAQQSGVGAVGAKLLFADRRIQHAGVVVVSSNPTHACYGFDGDHPGYVFSNMTNRNYLAVTAACLMVRHKYFEEVNGLDETFDVNYNDVDFCLKLHRAGYRNVMTPDAELFHYESMTRPPSVRQDEIDLFRDRWMGYINSLGGDPYYNANFIQSNPFFQTPW